MDPVLGWEVVEGLGGSPPLFGELGHRLGPLGEVAGECIQGLLGMRAVLGVRPHELIEAADARP